MDMLIKFPEIRLSTAIEVFAPMFVLGHHWNEGDTYPQVFENKKQFVKDTLLGAVASGQIKGDAPHKVVRGDDGYPILVGDNDLVHELDVKETWFDTDEATRMLFGLLKDKKCKAFDMLADLVSRKPVEEDVIDQGIIDGVEAMPLPMLKKKVTELTNEKVKWDYSIKAATQIGLLFYEGQVEKNSSFEKFKAECKSRFNGLHGSTAKMIYDSLPDEYRNLGTKPSAASKKSDSQISGLDVDAVDTLIEMAVAAGYLTMRNGVTDLQGLKGDLEADEIELLDGPYLGSVSGKCKKIAKMYKEEA